MNFLKQRLRNVSRKMSASANFVGRKLSPCVSFKSWDGKPGSYVWGLHLFNIIMWSTLLIRFPVRAPHFIEVFAFSFLITVFLTQPFFKAASERRQKRDQAFHKSSYRTFKDEQAAKIFREKMGHAGPVFLSDEDEDYIVRHFQDNVRAGRFTHQELFWINKLNERDTQKIKKPRPPTDE